MENLRGRAYPEGSGSGDRGSRFESLLYLVLAVCPWPDLLVPQSSHALGWL